MSYFSDRPQLRKILPILIFMIILFIDILWFKVKTYELSVNGTIQKIRYEEPKHIAYPTIRGKEYDLYYSSSGNGDTLSVGDSIIKEKGNMNYKLIKNKLN